MIWLKRFAGLLGTLLGAVGVVACLTCIVFVWRFHAQVDDIAIRISARIDVGLARMEERTVQIGEYIDTARQSTRQLNEGVQRRVAELGDVPLAEAADLDQIERQLYARIQLGSDWIGFIQTTIELIEQLFQMVESASLFVEQESHSVDEIRVAFRAGQNEFQQTSRLVDEIRLSLTEIRQHGDVEENAKRMNTLTSRVESSLTAIGGHADDFSKGVADARIEFALLATRIRRQALIVAVILTLLLVWMGAAQFSLAVHGWRGRSRQAGDTRKNT